MTAKESTGLSTEAKWMLVRARRKGSARGSLAMSTMAGVEPNFPEYGTRAKVAVPVISSTSSALRTLVSSASRRTAATRPRVSPATRPSAWLRRGRGWVGNSGVLAGWTTVSLDRNGPARRAFQGLDDLRRLRGHGIGDVSGARGVGVLDGHDEQYGVGWRGGRRPGRSSPTRLAQVEPAR